MTAREDWLDAHIRIRKREFGEMLDHYLSDLADGSATIGLTKAWILDALDNRDWVIVHKEALDHEG